MSIEKQRFYKTEDPKELARQLIALENSIDKVVRELESRSWLKVVDVRQSASLRPGFLYRCDTSDANVTVTLVTPTLSEAGTPTVFWKIGSNTLTIASEALVGGVASITLSSDTNGYLVTTDGETYRREF